MTPYYSDDAVTLYHGDCLAVLGGMADDSIDAVVTDPPYGLAFMGKKWDYDVPPEEVWRECLRVLKPGGHLLCFAGTRTQHRMAVRIEDAGFEIRDMIAWVYGCLSEDTEIMLDGKWEPYHKAIAGKHALCYNADNDTYEWQAIREVLVYGYDDTAYHLESDTTDQLVSRNHRCLVERGGGYVFQYAETLQRQARVPVLEDMPSLLDAVPLRESHTSHQEQNLFQGVRDCGAEGAAPAEAACRTRGNDRDHLCGLRQEGLEAEVCAEAHQSADLFAPVQRTTARTRVEATRAQGACCLDAGFAGCLARENAGRDESRMEGRSDVLQDARQLYGRQVRALSCGVHGDGTQGRLCHGTPADSSATLGAASPAVRGGASQGSRPIEQPSGEPCAICQQRPAQAVRGEGHTSSTLATVTPVHYEGVVWCVCVPSGAFVVRRNGKAFVTGNSGFPKSLDVSKAIDKAAGAEREVVGPNRFAALNGKANADVYGVASRPDATAPATPDAERWQGWGTALKPALEPITVARKPLIGTVAANVLEHGTGGINVDACRVGTFQNTTPSGVDRRNAKLAELGYRPGEYQMGEREPDGPPGRWPANLIHDGSEEAVALFPDSLGCGGSVPKVKITGYGDGVVGTGESQYFGGERIPFDSGSGSAARFFYCAKASKRDRDEGCEGIEERKSGMSNGAQTHGDGYDKGQDIGLNRVVASRNHHPTVKPTDLMRYLCRLVTPPGGTVLDPFMGSGSTGKAAVLEGFGFIGIEREAEYVEIAKARISAAIMKRVKLLPLEA